LCRNPTLKKVWGRHSHSRKWEFGVLWDSRKLRRQLQGSKHLALRCSLYRWKGLEVWMSKMASHESFGHLQLKLWAKEGLGVKLAVWLLTTKSRELTRSRRALGDCDTVLESSRRELQHWFRPRPDRRSGREAMIVQSLGSPNRDSFGTPFWESWDKKPFGCSLHGVTQSILYGGRWWLPPSLGLGESSESKCLWLIPTPKGVPKCELTLLWLVLDAGSSEIILVPLPSLIPGLLTRPSTPF
jgi:hypothetical protein